ncbi:MAG: DUF4960 domain-containing protein [Paludibacteraceae bacterium]|nr:DUF4960 domain-containing protein [Paludibacteraceae bacterium]
MQKFFLFSLALVFAAFSVNAQVAYLLTVASVDDFPAETFNEVDQQPERNAANWFKATYIDKNHGSFVSVADLKAGLSEDVKVLWINVDRVGLENLAAAGIDADAIAAVKSFVENGGQLLLTKQANMIAYNMGRIGYAPGWGNGGYGVGGDIWTINAQLGLWPGITEKFDRRSHPIYAGLTVDNTSRSYTYEDQTVFFETYPLVGAVARTDNNNMWVDMFRKEPLAEGQETHYDNGNPLRIKEFEADWNCAVLAVWGHVLDYCGSGIIEFKPQDNFKGTILTNGFAAYQWGTSNDYISNVQLLTKNSINYLLGYDPDQETVVTDLWKGSQHISWETSLKLDAAKFANAQAGNKLVVHYANASDGIEFKVMNQNYAHLAGSREAAWIGGEGIFEQFLTVAAVDNLKQYGLEIVGANFDLTQVELLEGKELKEGITVWTGFFWADSWTTLELYKEGYSYVDWSKIESVRIYSEANRTNYTINVKSTWEDDGHIADKGAMTDGEGYAQLALTDEMREKLAASGHLMVQFDKGEGEAFNATDIVLVEKAPVDPDGLENINFNELPADAVIYNILGMRVQKENAHNGIFIVNGRKMYLR